MSRGYIIAEGQTEETFIRDVLAPHLGEFGVFATACRIETGRKTSRTGGRETQQIFRGGVTSYDKMRKDILRWLNGSCDWVSTMFDLYALPDNFPNRAETNRIADPYRRVEMMETAFERNINCYKFIPYLQLHEFEALLFSDPAKFSVYFIEDKEGISKLQDIREKYSSPEDINNGGTTAPSKRIIRIFPEYEGAKVLAGSRIASAIGLGKLREQCRHFDQWVAKLEKLRGGLAPL